jgi:purine-binding chemotaxis protein CheW
MSRPRRPAETGKAEKPLPEAGLAEDLLAYWERGGAPAAGPERLYEIADHLASRRSGEAEAARETPETWVAVETAGEVYVLPVERVEEVLRVQGITRLPFAPAPVRGIAQQRGRVLTVVDLRVRLGFAPTQVEDRSRICVVTSRGRSLGLLVDAARGVVKLLPSGKRPAPPEVLTEKSGFILGVYRLDDALAILLDLDRVLLLDEEAETTERQEERP